MWFLLHVINLFTKNVEGIIRYSVNVGLLITEYKNKYSASHISHLIPLPSVVYTHILALGICRITLGEIIIKDLIL